MTAVKKYLRQHPEVSYEKAVEACKKENFKGGIHLAPMELRDFFCTKIAAKSDDVNVAMRLMRHTNLATTIKYMRTVETRMREAVEILDAILDAIQWPQKGLKCHNWPTWKKFKSWPNP